MRAYELVLVTKTTLGETELKKLLETVQKWLGEAKTSVEKLGKKTLAYPIKKEREGVYVSLTIDYKNGTVIPADLDKKLQIEDNLLRHLLIRRK